MDFSRFWANDMATPTKNTNGPRIPLAGLVVASLLASGLRAQSPSQHSINPLGTWRGTSVCLVRPSACHDETVVYRIARMNGGDSLKLDARKIVGGQEQEMGVLTCVLKSPNATLTCVIPHGTWLFRVHDDSLVGELRQPDNKKFRDVRAIRAP